MEGGARLDANNGPDEVEQTRSMAIKILYVWSGFVITGNIWCESFLRGTKGDKIWGGKFESPGNNFGFGFQRIEGREISFVFPCSSTTTGFCFSSKAITSSFLSLDSTEPQSSLMLISRRRYPSSMIPIFLA